MSHLLRADAELPGVEIARYGGEVSLRPSRRFLRQGPGLRRVTARSFLGLALAACGSSSTNAGFGDGGPSSNGANPAGTDLGSAIFAASDGGASSDAVPTGPGTRPSQVPAGRGNTNGLHVDGNQIKDTHGAAVHLQGVNRAGTEYACVQDFGIFDGPSDQASITAIKSWKVNAVRIPLNEDCWLAINGVDSQYSGPAYQQAIAGYVQLLLKNGIYPILDLHWTAAGSDLATEQQPMPDQDHSVTFWKEVATAFRSDPAVVFELFNEPWPDQNQDTDAAWSCWQNGGTCSGVSYPVAGMQSLVSAVRGTGATNLLLLGGVEYSNGLSQWAAHKPSDPLNNLAAAWHVYPENPCNEATCWDANAGVLAAAFPIVTTEVGDSDCDGAFPTGVMTWLDAHQQNYLGWVWNTFGTACSSYSLVTDYDGTPSGAYGAAFKAHFAAGAP